jgi:twitching motility protein PilI
MANKDALKALQHRLAERLKLARELPATSNWLAVETSGYGFLLPLAQTSEIFAMSALQPVPHCIPWFLGIANLRGHLHTVVDLAEFIGLPKLAGHRLAAARTAEARGNGHLIALNMSLQTNAALLVDRLLGIRKPDELQLANSSDASRPHFVVHEWKDASGHIWYELNLAAMVTDEVFLKVAA